jgi:hypothetical protein
MKLSRWLHSAYSVEKLRLQKKAPKIRNIVLNGGLSANEAFKEHCSREGVLQFWPIGARH